jgi:hypothetical protein
MSKILAVAAALGLVLALGTFDVGARSGGSSGVGVSGGPKKPQEPCCTVKASTKTKAKMTTEGERIQGTSILPGR